jgi:hypothetical protein
MDSSNNPFYSFPNELWLEVGQYLSLDCDKLAFLRVSRRVHDIGGYLLYKRLDLYGSRAASCLASLATKTTLASFYSFQIRDLRLSACSTVEKYLCFPVLARVIADFCQLQTLKISCLPRYTSYLSLCLERTGVIRRGHEMAVSCLPSSLPGANQLAFPSLRNLSLDTGPELFPLLRFRNLVCFESSIFFSYDTLGCFLNNIRGEQISRTLEELFVRLEGGLSLDEVVLPLGIALPRLRVLGLQQPKLKANVSAQRRR